jgi:hypothetical protein
MQTSRSNRCNGQECSTTTPIDGAACEAFKPGTALNVAALIRNQELRPLYVHGPLIRRRRVSGAPSTGFAAPNQPRAYPLFQKRPGTEALTISFVHDFLGLKTQT